MKSGLNIFTPPPQVTFPHISVITRVFFVQDFLLREALRVTHSRSHQFVAGPG